MRNILIIAGTILGNAPQPIRFRQLANFWKDKYNVTILTKDNFISNDKLASSIEIIKIPYSHIGRILISNIAKTETNGNNNPSFNFRTILRSVWRRLKIKKLIFPDVYIFEIGSLKRTLKKIAETRKFDHLILSVTPFSFFILSKFIKQKMNTRITLDISDPFWGSGDNGLIKPLGTVGAKLIERRYLKYFDKFIVYSSAVKNLYVKNHSTLVKGDRIAVIEQGIEKINEINVRKNNNNFTFVYAGGFYHKMREPFVLYQALELYDSCNIIVRLFGGFEKEFYPSPRSEKFYLGGSVSQEKIWDEYLAADVILFIDNFFGAQVPGKILEVIAAKKPILFIYENEISPTLNYIKNYKAAVKVKNRKDKIIEAINYIINHYSDFDYSYDFSEYTWSRLAEKYISFIEAD